jgi:repressor LexA
MRNLSSRQKEILVFCEAFIQSNGYAPTYQEIANEFSFKSPNAAYEHLKALQAKGMLRVVPRISRGIVLTGQVRATQKVSSLLS